MLIVIAGEADDELVTVSDTQTSSQPLQLTTADGECVFLYTVNTTNCTHYCDSDTYL